ncbi:MAG: hypothetical protein FWD63_05665 [Propionibacteriaceae bacterium]|nr:hypothetical protein [Propionibacteriaceae bacterium]
MTTPGRVDGIFLKLDAWLQYDPDLAAARRAAGINVETLYVRALCQCKRTLRDGDIPKSCLAENADGMTNPRKLVTALVNNGLWIDLDDHWHIRNWLEWQTSEEQRLAIAKQKREAGRLGGHRSKHSVNKPVRTCEYCQQAGWVR